MAQSNGNVEEDYNMLQSMAERLGLDDKQREGFISESMQRFGYKPKTSWEAAQEDGDQGGSNSFFGGGGKQQRGSKQGGGQGNSGGGWQYE